MSRLSREIREIIRSCFSRIWNRQFLVFLFFVALSAAFWLFQMLNETYECDVAVKLEMRGQPDNAVLITDLPSNVHLRLRDRRATLLNYLYGKPLPAVTIDWNEYANASGHVRVVSAELLKRTIGRLEASTQLISVRPDTLELFYNYGLSKRVPIRFQGTISAADGYSITSKQIRPDSVMVYAAKSVLDTITAAYVRPAYIKDIKDTLNVNREFSAVRGAKFVPNEVSLHVVADHLVEKSVSVPVQGVNFPGTKVLRTFPARVTITFQVGMGLYRRITEKNFVLVVNYEDLLKNSSNKCHLSLKSVPDGVSHVRISPQDVEYLVEEITLNEE